MQSSALEAKESLAVHAVVGSAELSHRHYSVIIKRSEECESDRQDTVLTAVVCSWAASPCSHREMKLGDQISFCLTWTIRVTPRLAEARQ